MVAPPLGSSDLPPAFNDRVRIVVTSRLPEVTLSVMQRQLGSAGALAIEAPILGQGGASVGHGRERGEPKVADVVGAAAAVPLDRQTMGAPVVAERSIDPERNELAADKPTHLVAAIAAAS